MSRFDEIRVGDTAEIRHEVTAKDLAQFVELTGDDNRLHTDSEYAARTTFKRPVAHGMLGASFISTVIGTRLPGDGALWFAQSLEFLLPVRVGDELAVRAEVLRKDERMRVVELQTDIFNQHRQKVTTGVAKVKIVEPDPQPEQPPAAERRVALVVGGSGGIGSAVCRMLAKDGFDVAVHYHRNREAAQQVADAIVADGGRASAVGADIGVEAEVSAMVEQVARRMGPVSVLVNCSSERIAPVKLDALRWEDIERHVSLTVRGALHLVRCVVPAMEKRGYGKIIHITSQSVEAPAADLLPYITAKSALAGFSRALAADLAPKGIRVNMVSPGMTDTEQIGHVPERVQLLTAARTPLRRLGKPEDVAGAVAFLASDRADYLSGETIRVNGGQVML